MDKPKSKDDLRAAGKKRLEAFRQKKQQKGSSAKGSGTPQDDNKAPSGSSLGPDKTSTEHGNSIPETTEHNARMPEGNHKESPSIATGNGQDAECANSLKNSSAGASGEGLQEIPSIADIGGFKGLDIAGTSDAQIIQEASQQSSKPEVHSEVEAFTGRLKNAAETTEETSSELVVTAKESCQEKAKMEALIAEMVVVKEELSCLQQEKAKLVEDFGFSQKDLQNKNQHLTWELKASHQQVVDANNRASRLSVDFGLVKNAMAEKDSGFALQLKSMQQTISDRELKREELMTELDNANKLVRRLQDEQMLHVDEVEQFGHKLRSLGDEKVKVTNELEESKVYIQDLEDSLASKQKILQQLQHSEEEKSQLLQTTKTVAEKLEAIVLNRQQELDGCRDQLHQLEGERDRLIGDVQECGNLLHVAKQKEDKLLCDLEVQSLASQEQSRIAKDAKAELYAELENIKVLEEERAGQQADFDMNVARLKGELERIREENTTHRYLLQEARQEVLKAVQQHAEVVKNMELELNDCRAEINGITGEKSNLFKELQSGKEEILVVAEKKGQEIMHLRDQLQECRDLVKMKVEENSAIATLLQDSSQKLEKAVQLTSDLTLELEKHRATSDGLLKETKALESEVMRFQGRLQNVHQTAQECKLELEDARGYSAMLENERSNLSEQLKISTDELAVIRKEKEILESYVVTYGEQVTKLEERNSGLMRFVEESKTNLQQLSDENVRSHAELAQELEKEKIISSRTSKEKGKVESELQEAVGKLHLLQEDLAQFQRVHVSDLDERENQFAELKADHTKLSGDLSVVQDELSSLRKEKHQDAEELVKLQRTLRELGDVNQELAGSLAKSKESMDAFVAENVKLLRVQVPKRDKSKEKQQVPKESRAELTAHLQKLLNDVKELKNERRRMGLEIKASKGQHDKLRSENSKLASEISQWEDRLEQAITEQASKESAVRSELERFKEHMRNIEDCNAGLMTELEDERRHLRELSEQKSNEVQKLQSHVQELVQLHEQMSAVSKESAQELEAERIDLVAELKRLSEQVVHFSEERSLLTSNLEVSQGLLHELENEKIQLRVGFELHEENWQAEKMQLSRSLEVSLEENQMLRTEKARLESKLADLTSTAGEVHAQQSQLAVEVAALKEFVSSAEVQKADLVAKVEDQDQQLRTLREQKCQLERCLVAEKENVTSVDNDLAVLSEDLRAAKLKREMGDSEMDRLRADCTSFLTQVKSLTEDKGKAEEKLTRLVLELKVLKEEQSQHSPKTKQTYLQTGEEASQLTEELLGSPSGSNDAGIRLASCVRNLVREFENKTRDGAQSPGSEQHSPGFTLQVTELFSQLKVLRETSKTLKRELTDAQTLEDTLRMQLKTEEEHNKQCLEENLHLKVLIQELESKQHWAETASGHVAELQSQVTKLAKEAASLEEKKDRALEAQSSAQSKLIEAEANLKRASDLANQLQVTEAKAATLQLERDDCSVEIVSLQESNSQLHKAALEDSEYRVSLQNQVRGFEVQLAEKNAQLEKQKLHAKSLMETLEATVSDAFPEGGQEIQSLHLDGDSDTQCLAVASMLRVEIPKLCLRLQHAEEQISKVKAQLHQAEEDLASMQVERDIALGTSNDVRLRLERAAEQRDELEAYVRKFLSLTSAEEQVGASQLEGIPHHGGSESNRASGNSVQDAALTMKPSDSPIMEREMKSIVSRLPGAVNDQETSPDSVLIDHSVCRLLEEGIMSLLRKCEDLERTISYSSESEQFLLKENSKLNQTLQAIQEALNSKELDLETLQREKEEQATAMTRLFGQVQILNDQLKEKIAEKASVDLRLSQTEQKLSVTKEKLSLAVNKGKATVQQRDSWKLSVAEKSSELELLVGRHQQDLQEKHAALSSAERKVTELTASKEQMVRAETKVDFLQNLISSAERVFLEKGGLVEDLSLELDSQQIPENWHSIELVDKILWVTSCATKLLCEVAARKEDVKILTRNASTLTINNETLEARIATLAAKERSLEHDKEHLASRLDESNIQRELELRQPAEEMENLSAIVRQKDLDIARYRHDLEGLVKKLEESHMDITSASRNATEQRKEFDNSVESYQSLNATLQTLLQNLSGLYDSITLIDFDGISTECPPLLLCKHIVHLLINSRSTMVVKLKELLHQASSLDSLSAHGEALRAAFQTLNSKTDLQEVSTDLIKRVEEAFDTLERQTLSLQTTEQQCDKLAHQLASEESTRKLLQVELSEKEQKLTSARAELDSVVNECKAMIRDNGSLKQACTRKDSELETLATAHSELQANRVVWQAELEKSRIAETHLSSALELETRRTINLSQQLSSLEEEKRELLRQLQSSTEDYRVELQQVVSDKSELISKISALQENLTMQRQEKEILLRNHGELVERHTDLSSQIGRTEADVATLHAETEILHQRIVELEASLRVESLARERLEFDVDAVVARLQECAQEPFMEGLGDSSTLIPKKAQLSNQIELLVMKCKASAQKVQELADENAVLTDSQQRTMENATSDRKTLEELQQRLLSMHSEITEANKRLEAADLKQTKQADAIQSLFQELQTVKRDLVHAQRERDTLQSEIVLVEEKAGTTREKLALAIKKGKGLAQQRESLTQLLAEQKLAITNSKEELLAKQSELVKAKNEASVLQEDVRALEKEVSSTKDFALTLEQNLQSKNSIMKKMEALVAKCDYGKGWQSVEILEKLERLVATVADSRRNLIAAGKEAETMKRASAQLSSQLRSAQTTAAAEQESRSIISLKLEDCERDLKQIQMRVAELEEQALEIGNLYQQAKVQSKQILKLEATLQQKQVDVNRAEEIVAASAERSEETKKYIHWSKERISDLEQKDGELVTAREEIELLHDKIAKMENIVQRKEAAVKGLEVSRAKAVGKLTTTVNKFQELCQQSEGLVKQMEKMHESLQEKNSEIVQLQEEVAKNQNQSQTLQENLESKITLLSQLERLLTSAIPLGRDSRSPVEDEDVLSLPAVSQPDDEVSLPIFNALTSRLSGFIVQSQAWQADAGRKDVQLQQLTTELKDADAEKAHLKENLQKEQIRCEQIKAELSALQTPLRERDAPQMEEIEEVQLGKRPLPLSSPAPHVRGARKPVSMDVTIDMDVERTRPFAEIDNKGHGFKSLTSSRLLPRGTHTLAGHIDRLCVAGGRVLMRKPAARLGLTLYWLTVHIWILFLISAPHL